MDIEQFRVQLGQSPILTAYAKFVSWAVPATEIILAALLIFHQTRLFALYGCFALMTIFTVYIIVITNFSEFVPCSCGGVLEDLTWNQHLVFNLAFVAMAAAAIFLESSNRHTINHSLQQIRKSRTPV
jgi:hypothetical protein